MEATRAVRLGSHGVMLGTRSQSARTYGLRSSVPRAARSRAEGRGLGTRAATRGRAVPFPATGRGQQVAGSTRAHGRSDRRLPCRPVSRGAPAWATSVAHIMAHMAPYGERAPVARRSISWVQRFLRLSGRRVRTLDPQHWEHPGTLGNTSGHWETGGYTLPTSTAGERRGQALFSPPAMNKWRSKCRSLCRVILGLEARGDLVRHVDAHPGSESRGRARGSGTRVPKRCGGLWGGLPSRRPQPRPRVRVSGPARSGRHPCRGPRAVPRCARPFRGAPSEWPPFWPP